ncbi:MAG: hypothetical protein IKV53_07585 [Clostridia bacterium]|nr:hypothetical protein [Clostridia bacterium]
MKRFLLAFFVVLTLLSACKPDCIKETCDAVDTGETVWYGTGNGDYPEYCDVISWVSRSSLEEALK